jgi:hypothetical protein
MNKKELQNHDEARKLIEKDVNFVQANEAEVEDEDYNK